MPVRGVRGANVATDNTSQAILESTRQLLEAILASNPALQPEDIASIWFTVTSDLNAAYPAQAARQMGWTQVPLMCAQEIEVPGSLSRCIRVLLHWNTTLPQAAIHPVYLGQARNLRPDLAG